MLASEFGFSPHQRASAEAWLAKVVADPAEYQGAVTSAHYQDGHSLMRFDTDTVDRLRTLLARLEAEKPT